MVGVQTIWITITALLATAAALGGLRFRRSDRRPVQVRRVRIQGGYWPAELHVEAGRPTRLVFRREDTSACSEYAVFPDLGISVMLPPFEDVSVDLPPIARGEHPLTCKTDAFRGMLVVDAPSPGSSAATGSTKGPTSAASCR